MAFGGLRGLAKRGGSRSFTMAAVVVEALPDIMAAVVVEALPDIMASFVVEALPEICCRGNVGLSVEVRLFIGVKAPLWPFLRGDCEDIQ